MKKTILRTCSLILTLFMFLPMFVVKADAAGKKTVYVISSVKVKTASGRVVDTYSYSYNKKGLVSKKTLTTSGVKATYKYSYNKNNQIVTETTYVGKKASYVHKYTYKNGILTKSVLTNKAMKEKTCYNYYYNSKNQLIHIESDQNPDIKLKYNSKGLVSTKDTGLSTLTYKYDSKGFAKKEYMNKKLNRIYKNKYVGKSNRRKEVKCYYGNGKKICTNYFTYKKITVDKANAAAIQKQQIDSVQDAAFEMYP